MQRYGCQQFYCSYIINKLGHFSCCFMLVCLELGLVHLVHLLAVRRRMAPMQK